MPFSRVTTLLRLIVVGDGKIPGTLATLDSSRGPLVQLNLVSPADAIAIAKRVHSDGVVVDGRVACALDVVRDIRAADPRLPIFFLAPSLDDVASALSAGANDFALDLTLPAELLLRLQFLTSGARRRIPRLRRIGALRLDRESRNISHGAQSVGLSPIELKLFERLLVRPGQPVSRTDLERSVWGQGGDGQHTNIAVVYVSYLRRKLAKLGGVCVIRTMPSVGYVLELEPTATARI
ncbi:MAG: response regulator transcription factor [bacterium]